jgi:hypothetical protein
LFKFASGAAVVVEAVALVLNYSMLLAALAAVAAQELVGRLMPAHCQVLLP